MDKVGAGATNWGVAANLVGRLLVWLGALLVVIGFTKTAILYVASHKGLEAVATIEATAGRGFGAGGWVDLSWTDTSGAIRRAFAVPVTSGLGYKLRLGSALARAHLRIRYQPESDRASVLIVEDVPEQIKAAALLAIAGFLAISVGSLIVLGAIFAGGIPAAASPIGRFLGTPFGHEPE